jgi:hypothetical protein
MAKAGRPALGSVVSHEDQVYVSAVALRRMASDDRAAGDLEPLRVHPAGGTPRGPLNFA